MLANARLVWRMQRWELLVLVGGGLLLALLMVLVAWQITFVSEGLRACYDRASGGPLPSSCRWLVDWGNVVTATGAVLPTLAMGLPFVAGILLGAPLVAREIEKRTAPLAWSMSTSRRRWLAGRIVPVLLAVAVSLLAVGVASEMLLGATREAAPGFMDFGAHGPIIAARGLGVLSIGVLIGLVVGRVLPAILLTGLVTLALVAGLYVARDQTVRAEATWVEVPADGGSFAMVYDSAWTDDATGGLVTYDQAFERFPEVFGPDGSWMPPGLTQVYLATPPELYPAFAAREAAALGVMSVVAVGLALGLIRTRRPE